jgi:hypothetical protein
MGADAADNPGKGEAFGVKASASHDRQRLLELAAAGKPNVALAVRVQRAGAAAGSQAQAQVVEDARFDAPAADNALVEVDADIVG